MADYTRIQNDTGRPLKDTLKTNGTADDLTGASVVITIWKAGSSGTPKVDEASATIETAADGTVKYEFSSGDLDTVGDFYFEWEVTYSGGTIITYRKENGDPKTLTVKAEGS